MFAVASPQPVPKMWTEVGRLVLLQLVLTELRCAEGKRLFSGRGLASPPRRETRRGIAVRRHSAPMRCARCIFTHDSQLHRGSRPTQVTIRIREACCRTRVQIQVGVRGEHDVAKAQFCFRCLLLQFYTLKLNCGSKSLRDL